MTRTIKAREIKEGMNIRFDFEGWDVKGAVARMHRRPQGVWLYTDQSLEMSLDLDSPVTVLSEPQPEEPTAFGAKVVAGGHGFLLSHGGRRPWKARLDGKRYAWADLCELGPVQVIPDQGWTAPETPVVPDRLEEWDTWEDVPEGVVVANPEMLYQYRKARGKNEVLGRIGVGVWGETRLHLGAYPGPWTRVSDA